MICSTEISNNCSTTAESVISDQKRLQNSSTFDVIVVYSHSLGPAETELKKPKELLEENSF